MKHQGYYQVGLHQEKEAVISAHFMDAISNNTGLSLYNDTNFKEQSLTVSMNQVESDLIPILIETSNHFIKKRIKATKDRALKNYKRYDLSSPNDVGLAEIITELMYDRQFLKGNKSNYCHRALLKQIKENVSMSERINLVLPALPYKLPSPFKSRGSMPDLAEVNFLLSVSEIVKAIDWVYQEYYPCNDETKAKFLIVCDGNRFNDICNESIDQIQSYQRSLLFWIKKLKLEAYIELTDYQSRISEKLPEEVKQEKLNLLTKNREIYHTKMNEIFNPYDMTTCIAQAIITDPAPEKSQKEGRFIPLFKSLIYNIKYQCLLDFSENDKVKYNDLYNKLIRNLFIPYTTLTPEEYDLIKKEQLTHHKSYDHSILLEYLRLSMLEEAWNACINYIVEIKSDRDLPCDPILTCLPEHIRWTIHEKQGQLAILTTTAFGDPVQAWHGSGVLKLSKKNKVKIYTLPALLLEGNGAIPLLIEEKSSIIDQNQPFCYIYPNIKSNNWTDLIDKLRQLLTRNRKQ